jgi:hypothetical protein
MGNDPAQVAKRRANISLFVSLLMLIVTFFDYSQQIFSFFGYDTPARAARKAEAVRKFMTAVTNSDWSSLASLTDVVAEGSLADRYRNSLYWTRSAMQHQAGGFDGFDLVEEGSGWRVCRKGDAIHCSPYDAFRFNADDLITDCHREGLSLKESAISPVSADRVSIEGGAVTAIPFAGMRVPSGFTVYVTTIRNTGLHRVSVTACTAIDSKTGQNFNFDTFPSQTVEPYQDLNIYCDFSTANVWNDLCFSDWCSVGFLGCGMI